MDKVHIAEAEIPINYNEFISEKSRGKSTT